MFSVGTELRGLDVQEVLSQGYPQHQTVIGAGALQNHPGCRMGESIDPLKTH